MSSNLKKEFKHSDVERMRNIIKKDYTGKTKLQTGYKKIHKKYKEGDVWEVSGKTWTIKNGIKQNITKLDKFKTASVPLFCPRCKGIMNKQLDPHYYKAFGLCLDCAKKEETQLKLSGELDKHTKEVHNKEIDKTIEEYTQFMNMKINESNSSFVTEAGEVEKWEGGINKERAEEALREGIEYLNSLKKD